MMKIITWNSRGNPTLNIKKKLFFEKMIKNLSPNIILIQECGTLYETIQNAKIPNYWIVRSPHAGALNKRCNSCIISDGEMTEIKYLTQQSSNGRAMSYGRYSVEYSGVRIFMVVGTMHSNAYFDAACDARNAFKKVMNDYPNTPIIIGGDFNTEPYEMSTLKRRKIELGTYSRGIGMKVAAPENCTINKKKYDYFVHNEFVVLKNTRRYSGQGGSDHFPVITEVTRVEFCMQSGRKRKKVCINLGTG